MAVGSASASASAIEENETYFDGDDEETDLGTASVNAGAMVLGSRSQVSEVESGSLSNMPLTDVTPTAVSRTTNPTLDETLAYHGEQRVQL